jgi:hydrogenase maturation protease
MKKADKPHSEIMIVGVGNRLLGDEGVGLHIIDKLSQIPIPPYVNIVDCGCDLLNLMAYLNKPERVIIIDAIRAGGEPGEIYSLDFSRLTTTKVEMCSAHQIKTVDALRLIKLIYPSLADCEILVIGVEPKTMKLGSDLSKEVSESITEVIGYVLERMSVRFFPWFEEKVYVDVSA